MSLSRAIPVMAFFAPVVNDRRGEVALRIRSCHGDVVELTFAKGLAAEFGRALLGEGAVEIQKPGPKVGTVQAVERAAEIYTPEAVEARRAQHLAAARIYLTMAAPRSPMMRYAEAQGLSPQLFVKAVRWEEGNPGQPWAIKSAGRGRQITEEQEAAVRAGYVEVKHGSLLVKDLAARAGVSSTAVGAIFRRMEHEAREAGAVLKPNGRIL